MDLIACFFRPKARQSVDLHCHDHVEWHYVLGGNCDLALGRNRTIRIGKGDLWAVPVGQEHAVQMGTADDWLLQYIIAVDMVPHQDLWQAWQRRSGADCRLAIGTRHQAFFASLARDMASPEPWSQRAAGLRFAALLCALVGGAEPQAPAHPAVARMLGLMHQRLRAHLSLGELARQVGLSPPHCARLFAAEIGEPPLRHFTHLKMRLAADLLADPDLSVTAVATRLGYDDPFHFSRVFHRAMGSSPRQWRRGG